MYDSSTQYTDTEKSKVFIKITKLKCWLRANSRYLIANKKFPLTVESTPVPEGIAGCTFEKPIDEMKVPMGLKEMAEKKHRATQATEPDYLGGLKEKYEGAPIAHGPAYGRTTNICTGGSVRMEKVIHDQLTESTL